MEYDFLNVYVNANTIEKTPVHNTGRPDILSGVDAIEWICKFKKRIYLFFSHHVF